MTKTDLPMPFLVLQNKEWSSTEKIFISVLLDYKKNQVSFRLSNGAIAQMLNMTPVSVSNLIALMQKKELITCTYEHKRNRTIFIHEGLNL
jgi:Mn-dependent DtxR family transcriptional regulator